MDTQTLSRPLLAPTQALSQGPSAGALPAPAAAAGAQWNVRQAFVTGGLSLMVRYQDGSELTELPAVHRLPNAPGWLAGICNLHGMLVPVFDLARWLALDAAPPARPMLLVLGHGPAAAGVVIDGLPQRLRWRDADAQEPTAMPPKLSGLAHRSVLQDGRLHHDIDCAALLDALERSLAP
jgi:twitching motility protein PilI